MSKAISWILFGVGLFGLYELITHIAKNTGEAYATAAMNERFGCKVIPALKKFFIVQGTVRGDKDTIIKTLEDMGCTRKAA